MGRPTGDLKRGEGGRGEDEKMKDSVARRNVKCRSSVCTEMGIYGRTLRAK